VRGIWGKVSPPIRLKSLRKRLKPPQQGPRRSSGQNKFGDLEIWHLMSFN